MDFRSLFWSGVLCLLMISLPAVAGDEPRDVPGRTELPKQRVVVPMVIEGWQPIIEVKVNGEGPFRFLFDTGAAGGGRISADLANRLGLQEVGEVIASDPSRRNARTVKRVGIDTLEIGGAKFSGIAMMRDDRSIAERMEQSDIAGIIGFGVFHDCLVTLDYPGGKLTIESGRLPKPDGKKILPFESPNGISEVTLRVGGKDVIAHIDSGSMGGIGLPKSVADKLKFESEPIVVGKASTGFNEFEIREGVLKGTIHLGSIAIENPVVAVNEIFPTANLGGRFLGHFAITFDQQHQRVRLTRNTDEPITMKPRYRVGVMLQPARGSLMVQGVVPDGPADKAGLKEGDRIIAINGKPLTDVGPQQQQALFGKPEPIKLTIQRGSERIEISLTPARAT